MHLLTNILDELFIIPMSLFKLVLLIVGVAFAVLMALVLCLFPKIQHKADHQGIWIKNRVETLLTGETEEKRTKQ